MLSVRGGGTDADYPDYAGLLQCMYVLSSYLLRTATKYLREFFSESQIYAPCDEEPCTRGAEPDTLSHSMYSITDRPDNFTISIGKGGNESNGY